MLFDFSLYAWIDICVSSIYMYAVLFIFVRFDRYLCKFDLNVCGSIYFCTVRFIFVYKFDLINVCCSIYFCTVRLIFV